MESQLETEKAATLKAKPERRSPDSKRQEASSTVQQVAGPPRETRGGMERQKVTCWG